MATIDPDKSLDDLYLEAIEARDDARNEAKCMAAGFKAATQVADTERRRADAVLIANNGLIEERRQLTALLCKALGLFRMYEASHRAKGTTDGDEKAERNKAMADKIETAVGCDGNSLAI